MDELQISGKRFISSRRVARENGYTSDYIGQLIRGGKIKGQKVGRAWYVEAASFDAYLGMEGAGSGSETPAADKVAVATESETPAPAAEEVAPVVEEEVVAPDPQPIETTVEVVEEVAAPIAAPEVPEEASHKIKITTPTKHVAPEVPAESPRSVPFVVATQQKAEAPVAPKQTSGLHYYADDEPALPEMRSNKKVSRHERLDTIAAVPSSEARVERPQKKYASLQILSLAMLGAAVFSFSAVVSSALSLNLSIEAGNTASAVYSIDW